MKSLKEKVRLILILHLIIFFYGCNSSTSPEVVFGDSTIEVMNFPRLNIGMVGVNSATWSKEYDFDKLNKLIYKHITSNKVKSNKVLLIVYVERTDMYGHVHKDKIPLKEIDVEEARKYKDYKSWVKHNSINIMLKKRANRRY